MMTNRRAQKAWLIAFLAIIIPLATIIPLLAILSIIGVIPPNFEPEEKLYIGIATILWCLAAFHCLRDIVEWFKNLSIFKK